MKSIEERLRVMEDQDAIRRLLLDYGRALDSRDTQAYADLFSQDAEWSGGIGQARTRAGIKKMLDDLFANAPKRTESAPPKPHHVMANMAIEVDGDTATAQSRWMWITADADGGPVLLRCGTYDDQLIRENGEWKFSRRRAVTEMTK